MPRRRGPPRGRWRLFRFHGDELQGDVGNRNVELLLPQIVVTQTGRSAAGGRVARAAISLGLVSSVSSSVLVSGLVLSLSIGRIAPTPMILGSIALSPAACGVTANSFRSSS